MMKVTMSWGTTRTAMPGCCARGRLRGAFLVACLIGTIVGTVGCVEERAFFIVQNQVPTSECTIPATVGEIYRARGTLDLRGGRGYLLFPVVKNELLPSAGEDEQPERNRLLLRSFDVELDLGALGAGLPGEVTSFNKPTSATLDPGGVRSTQVEVIPTALASLLRSRYSAPLGQRPEVVAAVQAVADHNGSTVRSPVFYYPIELCDGCLVTELPQCPGPDATAELAPNPCGLPQDQAVTCCTDTSRGFICLSSASSD